MKDLFSNFEPIMKSLGYNRTEPHICPPNTTCLLMDNRSISRRFSLVIHFDNPQGLDSRTNHIIFFRIFNNNEFVDFPRLITADLTNSYSTVGAYFLFDSKLDLHGVLEELLKTIIKEYYSIFEGTVWRTVSFDLRDDY
jgi:hypothetical protein